MGDPAQLPSIGPGHVLGDIIDSGVCHQAHFNDPDGNPLLLHQRHS